MRRRVFMRCAASRCLYNCLMADSRVEQRVDLVRKYVEKNRSWRPARRTIEYLAVMLVALVLAALFVPKLLPGTIKTSDCLLGRSGTIQVVPLQAGSAHGFIDAPSASESYSAWAMSESREEVIVGWYHTSGGKVDKVSVQSKSAFSGRQQVEWVLQVKDNRSRVSQLGFIPRHNQIWFLADGRIQEIDIKSSQILDFPFKGPEGKGELKAPNQVTYAAFSPVTGKLAYAEKGSITVVTGLASGRGDNELEQRVVLVAGKTKDSEGAVVSGSIKAFTWVEDETLAVVMEQGVGASRLTPVYFVSGIQETTRVALQIEAPSNGVFTAAGTSPAGTEIAFFFLAAKTSQGRDSIYVYNAEGRLSHRIGLPGSRWKGPLSWGS